MFQELKIYVAFKEAQMQKEKSIKHIKIFYFSLHEHNICGYKTN